MCVMTCRKNVERMNVCNECHKERKLQVFMCHVVGAHEDEGPLLSTGSIRRSEVSILIEIHCM